MTAAPARAAAEAAPPAGPPHPRTPADSTPPAGPPENPPAESPPEPAGTTSGAGAGVRGWPWGRVLAVAAWVVVALGIALRVRQWLSDRSFWQDEAALWLAMRGEDLAGLTRPLRLAQAAPVGWLWSEHGIMAAFGDTERPARLLPVLFGCGTVPLALLLARRLLRPAAALAATGLVAFSPLLVYYSAEFKQYSADPFFAVLLVLIGVGLAGREPPHRGRLAALAGAAALGVWFSHAAVLVTAGVLGALGVLALVDRNLRRLGLLLLTAVPPLASIAVEYAVSLSKTLGNDGLQAYWAEGFPPGLAHPAEFWDWVTTSVPRLMDRPLGLGPVGGVEVALVLGLLAAGVAVLARRHGRQLAVLLTPMAVLLAAAVAHAYPLADRLVLFAVPTVLLLVAAPIDLLTAAPRALPRWWRVGASLVAVAGVVAVGAPSVRDAARHAADPITNEETRPVVQYVAERLRPGDGVLIDTSKYPTQVYGPRFGMDPTMVRVVAAPGPNCQPGLAETRLQQRYGRVWLISGHRFSSLPPFTVDGYRAHLATIGQRVDGLETPGARVDLYDLNRPADDPGRTDPLLSRPGASCLYVP